MTSERWSRIKEVFQGALELKAAERVPYLDTACGTDEELRREVESLLEEGVSGGPLESPLRAMDLSGRMMGHYRIVERLGSGGMGVVYKAEDMQLGRSVALKFPAPHAAWGKEHRERFLREAKALAAIDHPNICPVYSIEEAEGQPFLAMALVDGPTLKQRLAEGPLSLSEVIRVVSGAAWGLEAAHRNGVVHRDVKSANILLSPDGRAMVTDFGLAQWEGEAGGPQAGVAMGTPAYMSPEQVRGEQAGRGPDIWALGVVLYEALTGRLPFRVADGPGVVLTSEPEPVCAVRPELPPAVERVVKRALAKDPAARYGSAAELARDLERARGKAGAASRGGRWKPLAAGFALAVTVLAAVIGVLYWRAGSRHGEDLRESVAVFPLKDISGDAAEQYFTEGMTDAITTDLARIGALRVISRTTSQGYVRRENPVKEMFRDFHVHYVVEGSVVRAAGKVRISVRLVATNPDRHVWAQSYEGDLRDVLLLQSSVAQAIANEVRVRLTPGERAQLGNRARVNPAAYEAFLRGRHLTMKWERGEVLKGREYFRQSIAADPNSASAYAGMADSYITEGFYWGARPAELLPEARRWAVEALRLDPNLGGPHRVLGLVHGVYGYEWEEARREFDRARELDPESEWAHYTRAVYYLIPMGRLDEALSEMEMAQKAAPASPNIATMAGWVRFHRGEPEEAAALFRRTLELEPAFQYAKQGLAVSLGMMGRYREALAASEHTETRAWVHALTGNRAESRKLLERLKERSREEYVGGYELAQIHAALGETSAAMEELERAYRERQPQLANVNVDPRLGSLRDEPRFRELVRRMGLAR